MDEKDMMKYIEALSKNVQDLYKKVQILHDEKSILEGEISVLSASIAILKGDTGLTDDAKKIVDEKSFKAEDDAISHFNHIAEVFSNTWNESDNMNKQR